MQNKYICVIAGLQTWFSLITAFFFFFFDTGLTTFFVSPYSAVYMLLEDGFTVCENIHEFYSIMCISI